MKLEEFRKKLEQDVEYMAAEKELRPLLDLADAVLYSRLEKGWSQAELAERVGTKQANISRLESGLSNPTIKFIQKVAKALGMELTIQFKAFGKVESSSKPFTYKKKSAGSYLPSNPAVHDE